MYLNIIICQISVFLLRIRRSFLQCLIIDLHDSINNCLWFIDVKYSSLYLCFICQINCCLLWLYWTEWSQSPIKSFPSEFSCSNWYRLAIAVFLEWIQSFLNGWLIRPAAIWYFSATGTNTRWNFPLWR
jgi:hypothetical protein